jgi:hypothetical protein
MIIDYFYVVSNSTTTYLSTVKSYWKASTNISTFTEGALSPSATYMVTISIHNYTCYYEKRDVLMMVIVLLYRAYNK